MYGVPIEETLNMEFVDISKKFGKLINGLPETDREALHKIGITVMLSSAGRTFEYQGARDGQLKWKILSDYTVVDRILKHGGKYGTKKQYAKSEVITKQQIWAERNNMKILRDTGSLANSVNILSISDSEVVVGTRLSYATKNQFGDPNNMLNGEKAPIPQRQFLWISDNDIEQCQKVFQIALENLVRKEFEK
jgi:phage gpG-like protein